MSEAVSFSRHDQLQLDGNDPMQAEARPARILVQAERFVTDCLFQLLGDHGYSFAHVPSEISEFTADPPDACIVASNISEQMLQGLSDIAPVIVLGNKQEITELAAKKAMRGHALGFITLYGSGDELVDVIEGVQSGELSMRLPDQASRHLSDAHVQALELASHLTSRECEALSYLQDGLSNLEIALKMDITTYTARDHIEAVLAKLQVGSRLQAVLFAEQYGIIEPGKR